VTLETIHPTSVLFSPSEDNEPMTFDVYLEHNFSLKASVLQPVKSSRIKETWASSRQKRTAFLHTELKIALFYALNPSLFPLGGYIGVSKRCCFLCDFVFKFVTNRILNSLEADHLSLRALQKDGTNDPAYAVDVAGPPFLFCVRGTHGGLTQNWAFPNTDAMQGCPSSILPSAKRELQKRLDAIRGDLSAVLKSKVESMLGHIRNDPDNRRGEESDGLSSESSLDDDAEERVAARSRRMDVRTARFKQKIPHS
jgi:hypothetical protein